MMGSSRALMHSRGTRTSYKSKKAQIAHSYICRDSGMANRSRGMLRDGRCRIWMCHMVASGKQ